MPLRVANGFPIGPAPGGLPQDTLLPVPYASQGSFLDLCWAACCQMNIEYWHAGQPQLCEITSKVFNGDCCADPSRCDIAVWPQYAYPALNFSYQMANAPLDPQSVSQWIAALYPIQAWLLWSGGQSSHTVLIVGVYANGDLEINDPDPSRGQIRCSYQCLLGAYGMGSWQGTWYDMENKANASVS